MMVRVRFNNVKFSEFTPREKIVAINDGIMEEYDAIRLEYHCAGRDFFKIVAHESAEGKPGVLDEAIAYYARDDDRVYDILRSILGEGVTICSDEAFCVTGENAVNEQETKEEDEMKEDVMDTTGGSQLTTYHVCLEVNAKSAMRVMLVRCDDKSRPANLVPLEGATIQLSPDAIELPECKQWEICKIVGDLCRLGVEADRNSPKSSACVEHLSYAYSILVDYVKKFDGDFTMSKETAETLIRGAMDRIVSAGKCFGFELDKYRTED